MGRANVWCMLATKSEVKLVLINILILQSFELYLFCKCWHWSTKCVFDLCLSEVWWRKMIKQESEQGLFRENWETYQVELYFSWFYKVKSAEIKFYLVSFPVLSKQSLNQSTINSSLKRMHYSWPHCTISVPMSRAGRSHTCSTCSRLAPWWWPACWPSCLTLSCVHPDIIIIIVCADQRASPGHNSSGGWWSAPCSHSPGSSYSPCWTQTW